MATAGTTASPLPDRIVANSERVSSSRFSFYAAIVHEGPSVVSQSLSSPQEQISRISLELPMDNSTESGQKKLTRPFVLVVTRVSLGGNAVSVD